jgi:hypothetical protein
LFPDSPFTRRAPLPPGRVKTFSKPCGSLQNVLASDAGKRGGEVVVPNAEYELPEELARHSPEKRFAPDELRRACRRAGERLGREDAGAARFRAASEMIEMWRGLDLPAWVAPYVLRDARLGYLNGYESALISGELSEGQTTRAAESR